MKKSFITLAILATLLILTSCKITVGTDWSDRMENYDTAEFSGLWSKTIENTENSKTEKLIVFKSNSYSVYLNTTIKLTNTVSSVEMERGSISEYDASTIALTQTDIFETSTHELTNIAPSFQQTFYINWDLNVNILEIEDPSTSTTHQNLSGTYTK